MISHRECYPTNTISKLTVNHRNRQVKFNFPYKINKTIGIIAANISYHKQLQTMNHYSTSTFKLSPFNDTYLSNSMILRTCHIYSIMEIII